MVVKYYDQSRIAFGDRNFHAVLACGEARAGRLTTEADEAIDRFLRFAEPPQHDEWTSTENLREQYQYGFRTALDDMFDTLRDGLRHLIAQNDNGGESLSKKVLGRFPIHDDRVRRRPTSPSPPAFEIDSQSAFDDGRWSFSGQIEVLEDEFEGWTVEISMRGVGEDGTTFEQVPIDTVEVSGADVPIEMEDGVVRIAAGAEADRLEFEGRSSPVETTPATEVTVGETRLEVRAELRTVEGE